MKKFLTSLLLFSSVSYAGNVNLTWQMPTQREDGSSLTQEEINKYVIEYDCAGYDVIEVEVEGNIYSTVVNDIYGSCQFRILTQDTGGQRGDWSNYIYQTLPLPEPNPIEAPTILDIVESVNIYWNIPEIRENGDPLPLDSIDSFDIAYKCNNRAEQQINIVGNTPKANIEDLYGDCIFKVRANDTDGLSSAWSNDYKLLLKLRRPQSGGFR